MFKKFILLCISVFISSSVIAQSESSSSSFYSAYGVGTLKQSWSGIGEGLGLNGVAFDYSRSANFSNPALLSFYSNTTALGAFEQSTYTGTENGSTTSYSDFGTKDLGLIFPIDKGKMSFSSSLHSLSYVNFKGIQTQTLPNDTTKAFTEITGSGGLNSFQIGIGYSISENISIGYTPSFIFGSIKSDLMTAFENPTYRSTLQGSNRYYSGLGHEFGILYQIKQLRNQYDRLVIGATFKLPTTLSTRKYQKSTIISSTAQQPITTELNSGTTDLPYSLKAGLTYYWNRNWITATDVLIENWSASKSPSTSYSYQNRIRAAGGFMYSPEIRTSANFFTSISYKLGVSYDSGYLSINSNSISKLSLHGGFGIPSPFTMSSVDLNFEYGRIGTTNNSLVQENIFTMKLVINLSEFMFFKRQLQ